MSEEYALGFERWITQRRNEVKQKTTACDFETRKLAVREIDELDSTMKVWKQFLAAPEAVPESRPAPATC